MKKAILISFLALVLASTAFVSCKKDSVTVASPTVTDITCTSVTISAIATTGKTYSGTVTVPYLGGNAIAYAAAPAISSTGVTGLSATLLAGTLASGAGNLVFNINGTPATSGAASFTISFGGQSCSFSLLVNTDAPVNATITGLTCTSATFSATASLNSVYSGMATVPYTGGNAATYSTGSAIVSTGVTGLSATLANGTLATGAGNLIFNITGTPATSGSASFALTFGGQSCSITLSVNATSTLAPYNKIYGATSITSDATYIIIKTNDLPDHKSIYYSTTDALYETFSGTTFAGYSFAKNPNNISTQTLTFKIPKNPSVASNHSSTPMGPIGVSLNGVPFYNQYAAGGAAVSNEIAGFDQWWGHPQNSGQYHYHVEPKYLTTVKATKSSLMGFLLDGFPVYGPEEDGKTLVSSDLDTYHGHIKVTNEYPTGIYHYHITADAPYLNGSGFYGTSGTVTQ